MVKTVAFKDVQINDHVYSPDHYAKWQRVTEIKHHDRNVELFLGVTAHDTIDTRTRMIGHSLEAITIKRTKEI